MKSSPLFSVIIPVYNVAPYLRECLDSVLHQTENRWECLCVDDGSTDGSSDILDEYATRDCRFRVFHQVNAGVSAARNRALDAAQGTWITFLDADDVYRNTWLAHAKELFIKNPDCQFVHMKLRIWNGEMLSDAFWNGSLSKKDLMNDDIISFAWQLAGREGNNYQYAIRKYNLEGVRFVNGMRLGEDGIFNLMFLANSNKGIHVDYEGLAYRQRNNSAVHSMVSANDCTTMLCEWDKQIQKYIAGGYFRGDNLLIIAKENLSACIWDPMREFFLFSHNSREKEALYKCWAEVVKRGNFVFCGFSFLERLLALFIYRTRGRLQYNLFLKTPYFLYLKVRSKCLVIRHLVKLGLVAIRILRK